MPIHRAFYTIDPIVALQVCGLTEDTRAEAMVQHLVFFSAKIPRRPLNELIYESVIPEIQQIYADGGLTGLIDIWFGGSLTSSSTFECTDPILDATLVLDSSLVEQFPSCLALAFDNAVALSRYYQHAQHAKLRRSVYSLADPAIASLYLLLDRAELEERAALGKAIEIIGTRYILRVDLIGHRRMTQQGSS